MPKWRRRAAAPDPALAHPVHDGPVDPAGVVHLTYTVDELAEALRLSGGLTYAMLRDGTIPAGRTGRRWIIFRRRIQAWLDSGGTRDDDA